MGLASVKGAALCNSDAGAAFTLDGRRRNTLGRAVQGEGLALHCMPAALALDAPALPSAPAGGGGRERGRIERESASPQG